MYIRPENKINIDSNKLEVWKSDDFPFATWVIFVGFQPWIYRG